MAEDFRIIAITPDYFYPGEAEAITLLLRSGRAHRVHLRKPTASLEDVRVLLTDIPAELHNRLSLHDHFGLAQEFGTGIHLNSRCPQAPENYKGIISCSLHSLAEIPGIERLNCQYAFLSPVFPSFSKPGYGHDCPPLTLYKGKLPHNIYALGGLTPAHFPLLREVGFSGAAMLTHAWAHPIPAEGFALQLITNPDAAGSALTGVTKALEGGCRWVQLRHKEASPAILKAEGEAIRELTRRFGAIMIVDDYPELCTEVDADGVHLGKNDMPVAQARRILGPSRIIGATANTLDDILQAAAAGADYIGLGPFRFTTTKTNLSPTLGAEGYARIVAEARSKGIRLPIVAIGGITPSDIPALAECGVQGVAISGAILSAPSVSDATRLFATACRAFYNDSSFNLHHI